MLKIEKIHFKPVTIRIFVHHWTKLHKHLLEKNKIWYIICVVYSIFYMCVIRSIKCKNEHFWDVHLSEIRCHRIADFQ